LAILHYNKKINGYCDEVVTEIRKIVWPSRRDTMAMTLVVCVIVVFSGFCLAVFDGISGYAVGILTKIPLP
jgi:preprotein translocase subunit SecE